MEIGEIAIKMFSRWNQENFFKYVIENFDFDKMIEYGTEPVNPNLTIPNPEYKVLTYKLKKQKEKKGRLENCMCKKLKDINTIDPERFVNEITKNADLMAMIDDYNQEIKELKTMRKSIPTRITVAQMPEENRYNKLKQESKKLKNIVIMLVYRSETALYGIMSEFYKDNDKEGRMILKEIFLL